MPPCDDGDRQGGMSPHVPAAGRIRRSPVRDENETEADIVVPIVGERESSQPGAAVGIVAPAAAPAAPRRAVCRSGRIGRIAASGTTPIPAQLPNVSGHVVQAPHIRAFLTRPAGGAAAVFPETSGSSSVQRKGYSSASAPRERSMTGNFQAGSDPPLPGTKASCPK